ncbi:flocculation protein FLO11 isoform X2 [Sphaeramia orbicularis]|uniref:flocculation protein FLO11 isoform X2 n=1 Tax=Sphaeramia orbicularis TaxID=375764 RepID=UPI001181325B|nr:flocculation protein FLO11-like isoform X2 [Sphaeramia orbicularis]
MKQYGGRLMLLLYSRMHVNSTHWLLPQMSSHLCLIFLSSLTVSSPLGLEDVFFSPQDQTINEGESVFFPCVSGESSPPARISWLKDGKLVTRGRQIQGEYGGGNQRKTSGTLHLFNVTLEDDGIYVCLTYNPSLNISKMSKPATLTVQRVPQRPQIIQGPDNITVTMGTEVSMHCTVLGFPVPMVHWFKDGCLLTNCSTSFSLQNNGQLLTFRNVTKEDEGSYHCEASNQEETIKSQPGFLLPAEMDWSFVQQPTNVSVKRGDNATVTCRPPHSTPTAQVSWFKNNQLLSPAAHVTVLPSGDLFFHSVQESDSGSYFCRAANTHLQRFLTSRRATITVLAPPSVSLWPQMLTVPVGARVVLECQVSGRPVPSISWVKRGYSKQTGGKTVVGLRNATLSIQSARSYDEGVYVCEASNPLGQSQRTAVLKVAVSPVIVSFAGEVSCSIGATAVLPCKAVGIQPIVYSWSKGRADRNIPIIPTEETYIDDGALHILTVHWYDEGEYYCLAKNRAGEHQRRTVLTVTAEDYPADRGKQTRLVLSANVNKKKPISNVSVAEQRLKTEPRQHVQTVTTCSSSHCGALTNVAVTFSTSLNERASELKTTPPLFHLLTQKQQNQPPVSPMQFLVSQMPPPIFPPPPYPNFKALDLHTQMPTTGEPPEIQRQLLSSQSPSDFPKATIKTHEHPFNDGSKKTLDTKGSVSQTSQIPETSQSKSSSHLQTSKPYDLSDVHSHSVTQRDASATQTNTSHSGSVTLFSDVQTNLHEVVTKHESLQFHTELTQIKLNHSAEPLHQKTYQQPTNLPALSYPSQSFTQSLFPKSRPENSTLQTHLSSTQLLSKSGESHLNVEPSPTRQTSTIQTPLQIQPPLSPTQSPLPQTESLPLKHKPTQSLKPQISVSSIYPADQTSNLSTLDSWRVPVLSQFNISDQAQVNSSNDHPVQTTESANDTKPTELLRRNTSQSPMTSNDPRVTQQSPSWLPVLEKHDIPIVVGVGVSLAFIFITVTFYSVVQTNEPAPTSRAAQRNLGVPVRHAERRAAGRTYENRAFEDDDCVAVIEQSPNTSDTRARPPGPSLVTVQLEPTSEDLQEDNQTNLDHHSVTVETYPEPVLDTKIDPSLEEEKSCTLSQPSIQLQCTEDWLRGEDNHSPCRDALPPPSPMPSRSVSPSPPSRRDEGLRSSLTLQTTEPSVAPIHHSLSISHGHPPLLLSHHVSLGLTNVAVDVHFYPVTTSPVSVGTSTHINSVSNSTSGPVPLYTTPVTNSQENDQSAPRMHHCK